MVRVAEDEMDISKDKHKPIIKEEIFNQVQNILYDRNVRINKNGKFHKYTGFLKCSECGNNLYRISTIRNNIETIYYYCGTYIKTKKCNKHYILEKELDDIILNLINKHIELVCEVKNKIDDTISYSSLEYNTELKKIRLGEIEKELGKYQMLLNELINDYKCDYISQDDYDEYKQKYLYEINKLNMEKENLKINKINSYNLDWLEHFKKIEKITKLDRNIIDSFIENIYVDDNKGIEILFRYKDQYKEAINYLKNTKDMI